MPSSGPSSLWISLGANVMIARKVGVHLSFDAQVTSGAVLLCPKETFNQDQTSAVDLPANSVSSFKSHFDLTAMSELIVLWYYCFISCVLGFIYFYY